MKTKQVIIMRKFPSMRIGKYCAQASHASMAFLTSKERFQTDLYEKYREEINHWIDNSFKKIVCYVETEEELQELHQKAIESGLLSHLITDSGLTEFKGQPTITALAIGPHEDSRFEGLTNHLPLF